MGTTQEIDKPRSPYSASVMGRRYICPASKAMEDGLPERPSDVADSGLRIHAAVACGDWSELDDDEAQVAEQIMAFAESKSEGADDVQREYAMELEHPVIGTADLVALFEGKGLVRVCDWKTGYASLDDRAVSFQGSIYGAAAMLHFEVPEAEVYFYQPRLADVSRLSFSYGDIDTIKRTCRRVIRDCERVPVTINPDPAACRYCKAASFCAGPRMLEKSVVNAEPREITGPQISELYRRSRVVKQAVKAVEAELKAALDERKEGVRYEYKKRRGNRYFPDVVALYKRLGLPDVEFVKLFKPPWGRVKSAWMERHADEYDTKTAAERAFAKAMDDIVSRGPDTKLITEKEI